MYAIVKDNKIEKTGNLKQLFPETSFAGGTANEEFKTAEGLKDVVNGERKDPVYYYVIQGDISLVGGVPTQQFMFTFGMLILIMVKIPMVKTYQKARWLPVVKSKSTKV